MLKWAEAILKRVSLFELEAILSLLLPNASGFGFKLMEMIDNYCN